VIPTASRPFISAELSVYLDAVRFLAAMAVLVGHLDQDGLHASWLLIGDFSHAAVVVFFVLSGLVISQSAFDRERDWRSYAAARFARIYSVVLPAIALSIAVKGLAVWLDPNLAQEFLARDLRPGNLPGSLLFLNESWGLGTALPWNGPYWSLCYEVWYYVIFGLALFVTGRARRTGLVALAALIAGPAILVLLPVWLFGVWLARYGEGVVPGPRASVLLWIASLSAIVALAESGLDIAIKTVLHENVPGFWRLESAQRFLTDYLLGLLVAANFVAFRGLGAGTAKIVAAIRKPVVFLAGYTFSLYLFHRPLTHFAGYFFPNRDHSILAGLGWFVGILVICIALGSVTEHKKHLLRRWARRLLDRAGAGEPARP
jgi:peptidoglycan/LPS O-acetylase OafA/YrhL